MGQGPTTFNFKFTPIRVVYHEDDHRFVATNACKVLGLTNTTMALNLLGVSEKRTLNQIEVGLAAGRPMLLISESGLFKLVMRSDKPAAREFQDWVTRTVLSAIRKDGMYVMGEEKVATGEKAGALCGLV